MVASIIFIFIVFINIDYDVAAHDNKFDDYFVHSLGDIAGKASVMMALFGYELAVVKKVAGC